MPINPEEIRILQQNLIEIQSKMKIFHDGVFKFNLRRIFPFNILFGSPDYEGFHSSLKLLAKALMDQSKFCSQRTKENPDITFFPKSQRYIDSLTSACNKLGACAALYNSQVLGNKEFTLKKLNQSILAYQEEVSRYRALAQEANTAWQKEKQQ